MSLIIRKKKRGHSLRNEKYERRKSIPKDRRKNTSSDIWNSNPVFDNDGGLSIKRT